ncbi:DUF2264 domain-containing protein [Sediminibacillus dalangtanensis]|uniref:DUF2264 domain-containing protein n=1 Tax=Sediminibacillus dalangtanensis TaxID=2729421 RepID=A0ABX7W003_9BACI|nr:DUF2264 domain-containing protein [Sediminibacillus dalangtanensis]QTN01414.1 DUF2264 domain-containing protein [Sediminibacillus dalangtanensis]
MNKERHYWLKMMRKVADPVLSALEDHQLKAAMPVEMKSKTNREAFSALEAIARLLNGMAPWLEKKQEDSEEEKIRQRYSALARKAIDAGTDPTSPDYMNFTEGFQPIVDAAFLAHAIIRAPQQLWESLDSRVKANVVTALRATRDRKPYFSNWLLFSAMIETALFQLGELDWDPMRIDYALKQTEQWYAGDGMYKDGPYFHYDYYNSFVIQPMLFDIVETIGGQYQEWQDQYPKVLRRVQRYAEIQERLIAADGTFPPVGRSLAYRTGVFHSLAQLSLHEKLPDSLEPAQVRTGLTAVIKRIFEMPGSFSEDGWLTIGLSGHQPSIGEGYISTGSTYLCTAVFLPLGLSADAPFWQDPPQDWTAKKVWSGKAFPIDRALQD